MSYRNELHERLAAQLAPLVPARSSILIGLSGGVDSVALLHLLQQLAPRFSWRLSALHVHHGISPNADAWTDFCAGLCAQHAIPLHIEHVDITPLREQHGIEAAARKLRHAAFARQACDFVALAHHADDQAETLLLQLLRGAGVRGASAMPLLAGREGSPNLPRRGSCPEVVLAPFGCALRVLRPLLHCSRQEILDYAATYDLRWIEDESNADDSYPRNFLRHRVLPLLEQKFPACRDTLTRSAQHFAEASELLDDLARLDAAQAIHTDTLAVAALQALSQPRAKNLLRYFLHSIDAPMPQTVQLGDMLHQLCNARADAAVCITYGRGYDTSPAKPTIRGSSRAAALNGTTSHSTDGTTSHSTRLPKDGNQVAGYRPPQNGGQVAGYPAPEGCAPPCPGGYWQVRRYRGRVYALRALGEFDSSIVLPWRGEAELDWPALNTCLLFEYAQGRGVSLGKLQRAPVTLRLRQGGETLRPHQNAATRTLKNLLQEHHVPPWQRDRLPLLFCGDELVCAADVAIAAEYQAGSQETGMQLVTRENLADCPGEETIDYAQRHK